MSQVAVHLYRAYPDTWDEVDLATAERLLDRQERERAAKFRFDRDRKLYVVAHALLRNSLAQHTDCRADALEFTENEYGRPELGRGLPRFSLSHTHGLATCAISTDPSVDVGIDAEPVDRTAPLDVARRCFSERELADVLSAPMDGRAERFFLYWTLKEAYVKARGIGLRLPLQHVAFAVDEHGVRFEPGLPLNDDASRWQFDSFRLGDRHRAALAVHTERAVTLQQHEALEPEDLQQRGQAAR